MTSATMIQNFTLPGEINRKFALNWSADNKISICTSKAIYILNSNCSPLETGFPSPLHKQVIKNEEKPLHLNSFKLPHQPYKFIKTETDRDVLHRYLMDHTLNSRVTERAEAFSVFRCCRWSPKGAAKNGRCLLATLTMDHRLCLYEERDAGWEIACDLSETMKSMAPPEKISASVEVPPEKKPPVGRKKKKKLKRKISEVLTPEEGAEVQENRDVGQDKAGEEKGGGPQIIKHYDIQKNVDLQGLREYTYKIAPTEILWTGMFGVPSTANSNDSSSEYCFLIAAMKSGHIQFWKVSANDANIATLVHEWDTGLGMLISLCWQQTSQHAGFLMCGSLKGILAFLPVSLSSGTDQEPSVTIKSKCHVWDEEDSVAVDHIAVLKIALKKYVIIAAKMHALVGCEIYQTDDSIIIRNVGHSFGLHRLPVTGMAVLDTNMPQYRLLMSSMEGIIVEIKVSLGEDEIKFQHEKVPLDLDLKNHTIQGLSVSTNGLLCGMILNTSSYFDHLAKKEPLQFVMFVMHPLTEVFERLRGILQPQFSFLPAANHAPVSRYLDFLECVRTAMSCGTPLPDWLLVCDESTLQNCSPLQLYFTRFILLGYVSGLSTTLPKDFDKESLDSALARCERALLRRQCCHLVGRADASALELLSPAQGVSLLLAADWLLRECGAPAHALYAALGCGLPSDPLPPRESCGVCKEEVPLESARVGTCGRGHSFARCCRSLLLCDAPPYRRCSSCRAIALPRLWDPPTGPPPPCTFCGLPMQ